MDVCMISSVLNDRVLDSPPSPGQEEQPMFWFLVKYQIKFGCLIALLLTTKVIDRLCYTGPTLILLQIPTLHI